MQQEEEYWLALIRAPGVGPVKFSHLCTHFGNPRAVFEASYSEWQAAGLKQDLIDYLHNPAWHLVEQDMRWLMQPNHHVLTLVHSDYPPLLRQLADSPPLLFVHGDYTLLSSPQVAMVGTRKPSSDGERTAREFAYELSHQGFTITSGMALGIDAVSHWGALAGSGKTIAVAGTGLDRVYPASHRELAHQIAAKGALVSEFLPGTTARREHFPRRSRIISGLSLGTLVVEAPKNSGALYAAQHAKKQQRSVFAVPGSIYNPLVKGCHHLLKEGVNLVETVDDLLSKLLITRYPLPVTANVTNVSSSSANNVSSSSSLQSSANSTTLPSISLEAALVMPVTPLPKDDRLPEENGFAQSNSSTTTIDSALLSRGITHSESLHSSTGTTNSVQLNPSTITLDLVPSDSATQKGIVNSLPVNVTTDTVSKGAKTDWKKAGSKSQFLSSLSPQSSPEDFANNGKRQPANGDKPRENNDELETKSVQLLNYLGDTPTSIDNLVELSGLTAGEVSTGLLMLELRGLVFGTGGLYSRHG
jgi:DNA processing protein